MTKAGDCDFCWPGEMVHFRPLGASQDYEREIATRKNWYAVLAPEQYSLGHTLVICKIEEDQEEEEDCRFDIDALSDDSKKHSEAWKSLAEGISQLRLSLKEELASLSGLNEWERKWGKVRKLESIHVLTLCEGEPHLHAHLIPRYEYRNWEKEFYRYHYFERERRRGVSKICFEERLEDGKIHGMWYAACREMNYDQTCFGVMPSESQGKKVEDLARHIKESRHLR